MTNDILIGPDDCWVTTPTEVFDHEADAELVPRLRRDIVHEILAAVEGTMYESGKSPRSLAASAYYLASYYDPYLPLSQSEAGDPFGVCSATIRKHYRALNIYYKDRTPGLKPPVDSVRFSNEDAIESDLPHDSEGNLI